MFSCNCDSEINRLLQLIKKKKKGKKASSFAVSDILPHTSPAKQCRQLANITAQSMWGDRGEKGWGGMPSEITFCMGLSSG